MGMRDCKNRPTFDLSSRNPLVNLISVTLNKAEGELESEYMDRPLIVDDDLITRINSLYNEITEFVLPVTSFVAGIKSYKEEIDVRVSDLSAALRFGTPYQRSVRKFYSKRYCIEEVAPRGIDTILKTIMRIYKKHRLYLFFDMYLLKCKSLILYKYLLSDGLFVEVVKINFETYSSIKERLDIMLIPVIPVLRVYLIKGERGFVISLIRLGWLELIASLATKLLRKNNYKLRKVGGRIVEKSLGIEKNNYLHIPFALGWGVTSE